MPRNEVIEFKVTAEEKKSIRSQAAHLKVPVSVFVRSCALREHLKGEEFDEATQELATELAEERTRVENDPSNLSATLDEKGSVVADKGPTPPPDFKEGANPTDEASWINHRAKELAMRMSTRAALNQAKKEWDKR